MPPNRKVPIELLKINVDRRLLQLTEWNIQTHLLSNKVEDIIVSLTVYA